MGIGEMASRCALDAKFEVRILDPQLKTPSYEGVFLCTNGMSLFCFASVGGIELPALTQ